MNTHQSNAYAVYLILSALESLCFSTIVTVNMVYQVETVGLNPLQLVLVGTVLEATCFLFEVPTGVVADVLSRRLSVIVSFFLVGLGFLIEGTFPFFGAVLIAQVVWGIGATFSSGALAAWVADELGEEQAGRAYLRASQVARIASLAGAGLSVALASVRLNLAVQIGALGMMATGVFLILAMPEEGFTPAPRADRSTWQHMAQTVRDGAKVVRRRPALITIFAIAAIYAAFSEGFDRLSTAHLLQSFTIPALGPLKPVVWFGLINVLGTLISLGPTEYLRRKLDTNNHHAVARALLAINTALIGAVIAFGLAGKFGLALIALLLADPLRSLNSPLQTAWINQRLDPQVRATVLSMSAQVDALGQIGGGPVLGVVGRFAGLRAAMVSAGAILAPALALYARTLRDGDSAAVVEESLAA